MDIHVRSRHQMRSSDAKKILKKLKEIFGPSDIDPGFEKKRFELVKTDRNDIILVDGEPLIFTIDDEPFLTVKGALVVKPEKRTVVVDAGATSFMAKGADVMRPGIVRAAPDIETNDLVIVVEETHGKALAIGRALIPGSEMVGDHGKAVKSIHRVGDSIWNVTP